MGIINLQPLASVYFPLHFKFFLDLINDHLLDAGVIFYRLIIKELITHSNLNLILLSL